jgi:hypothetical protein
MDDGRCAVCGGPDTRATEIAGRGVEAVVDLCDGCDARIRDDLARLREIFDGYLASGMSRETANRTMIRWHVRLGVPGGGG